jgi:hypothetical protein
MSDQVRQGIWNLLISYSQHPDKEENSITNLVTFDNAVGETNLKGVGRRGKKYEIVASN